MISIDDNWGIYLSGITLVLMVFTSYVWRVSLSSGRDLAMSRPSFAYLSYFGTLGQLVSLSEANPEDHYRGGWSLKALEADVRNLLYFWLSLDRV